MTNAELTFPHHIPYYVSDSWKGGLIAIIKKRQKSTHLQFFHMPNVFTMLTSKCMEYSVSSNFQFFQVCGTIFFLPLMYVYAIFRCKRSERRRLPQD